MSADDAIARFRTLLRIPTVSHRDPALTDWSAFERFREQLFASYPLTARTLEHELVAEHSLLLRWPGSEPGDPVVLMAHQDVVAADDEGWRHPPFAAERCEHLGQEVLWGRGTADDKGMLVAIMEAVEASIADGLRPRHDVLLAFGHDEEVGGTGAAAIVELLAERGIRPRLVVDEGGAVVEGVLPGVSGELAVIGLTEKGVADFELRVELPGGHAATPPRTGAPQVLAEAIRSLARHQARAELSEPALRMLEAVAPRSRGAIGFVFRHARPLRRVLAPLMTRFGPEAAAMVRTTRAVTRLSGSEGDNVLAERALAHLNVRVSVSSSLAEAQREIEAAIGDDRVRVLLRSGSEPSPVSRIDGPGWRLLTESIAASFPEALPVPYTMLQASDSRMFSAVSDSVYRFIPMRLSAEERAGIHAVDEHLRSTSWFEAIGFFRELLRRA